MSAAAFQLFRDLDPATEAALRATVDRSRLAELETVIERGQQTFVEVGNALMKIRDQRLYRETYATFETYCRERWGWSRISAYRHIEAAEVVQMLPMGNTPVTERVARELIPLSMDERAEVAERIDFTTATAAEVKAAAREIKSRERYNRIAERTQQRAEVLATNHPLSGERYRVFTHDIRNGAPNIATPAVIITDPPYPAEFLSLYRDLWIVASDLLPDGGSLLAMCGQANFEDIVPLVAGWREEDSQGWLTYQWTLGYFTPGQSTQVFGRHIKSNWKPILWYVKGVYSGEHVEDTIRSGENDKRFHEWGQSVSGMAALIERFTVPGDLAYDPFCGGGTTGVAALLTGRLFVGSDIDEACVAQTAARLNAVAP